MFSETGWHDISAHGCSESISISRCFVRVNTSLTSELGYVFHTDRGFASMSFAQTVKWRLIRRWMQYLLTGRRSDSLSGTACREKQIAHLHRPDGFCFRCLTNNIVSTAEYWMTIATGENCPGEHALSVDYLTALSGSIR